MIDSTEKLVSLTLAAFVAGAMLGAGFGGCVTSSSYEYQAVKHGAAQYNPTTAVFEWKQAENGGAK